MRALRHCSPRILFLASTALLFLSVPSLAFAKEKKGVPAVRWDELQPGCTFSRSDDGKYHYGLWSGDVGVTLSVDSQEREKTHRRHEPFFALFLSIRYRGERTLEVASGDITLEFVRHFKTQQSSLDPGDFAVKIQSDADAADHEVARELAKHPEKKAEKEAYMRRFQKETAELLEFVSKNCLRPAKLAAGNSEVSGWVLFSTQSKWIGGWKKPEDFVLRVPLDEKIFEFPFTLPPKPGEVQLRKRE